MKQTAIEWLIDMLDIDISDSTTKDAIKQALAMEKEQIVDAANDVLAQQDNSYYGIPNLGEQYYNETYK